ncbi:hypothetical protein GCM10028807_60600 [Spirosoma daeguense]
MDPLNPSAFSREEVRRRMTQTAAATWQMRVKDVESADPLVGYLMDACAYEFENTSKAIEATRQQIIDRLASVMCPEVIDLPRPAHAIFHGRSEDPLLHLPQTAQFFYRHPGQTIDDKLVDVFFSPVINTQLVNGDIRYMLSEQGLVQFRGRDRLTLEKRAQTTQYTDYQSVWLGIDLDNRVPSLANLSVYFDWENEPERVKATYYRKLHDPAQSQWFLNGQPIPFVAGLRPFKPTEPDYPVINQRLAEQLDVLNQLEDEVLVNYSHRFVTFGEVPDRGEIDYSAHSYPAAFDFPQQWQQKYFQEKLVWLELRLGRDFPPAALGRMEIRLNCFPIMNRHLNETIQRLQQSLNVYPLLSAEEFLFIRRVYDAETNDLFRSSPLRNAEELAENTFMWRPHGVGRFDSRNAREILLYVQQMLLEESRAFSALGSGLFAQTIENLNKNVNELDHRLQNNQQQGFKVGHPYIFVRPRRQDTNIHVEFWSTNGKQGNNIIAGTRLAVYDKRFFMRDEKDELFLVTTTAGGRDKPSILDKEQQLRQALLTRQRLVTLEDIRAECKAYFFGRLGEIPVDVTVEKNFAEGLIEGAGYVRCLDVIISPLSRTTLSTAEWDAECERCRQHLANRSAMNLPYRVRVNPQLI